MGTYFSDVIIYSHFYFLRTNLAIAIKGLQGLHQIPPHIGPYSEAYLLGGFEL